MPAEQKRLDISYLLEYLGKTRIDNTPILLIFHADFCPPCRSYERNLQQQLKKHFRKSLIIHNIDIENDTGDALYWKYANPHGIKGMPFTLLFDDRGIEVGHVSGYRPKSIRELVNGLFPKNPVS